MLGHDSRSVPGRLVRGFSARERQEEGQAVIGGCGSGRGLHTLENQLAVEVTRERQEIAHDLQLRVIAFECRSEMLAA